MKVNRVEKHIIKDKNKIKILDELCFKSKNLYNLANYYVRQSFIFSGREQLNKQEKDFIDFINSKIDEYNNRERKDKTKEITNMPHLSKDTSYIGKYFVDWLFKNTNLENNPYRQLPAQTSQQIIALLDKNWKSFFASIKDWKIHPEKYKGRPKLPKYKHKEKGRNIIIFTGQVCKIVDGKIKFPNKIDFELKTNIQGKIQQVRVIPRSGYYVVEVVYQKEIEEQANNNERYISIDLGINNLMTVTNNVGLQFFIINGKIIKSINQYYNKKKAKLMSYVGDRGTSKRLQRLNLKRNNLINDKIHKSTRYIINYCIENNIKNIVIGYNKGWKQEVGMGKVNNQKFVGIPFLAIVQQLRYKGEEYGIKVIEQTEEYTSKCDALGLEKIKKQKGYMGKRVKRGLFQSSTNRYVNADVNGSLNILRKAIGDDFIKEIKNITPVKINIV